MNTTASPISLCRHCQYYSPEGRRGGSCSLLNVDVKGRWKACRAAASPFKSSWERLKEIMVQQQKQVELQQFSSTHCTDIPPSEKLLEANHSIPMSMTASVRNRWAG